MRIIFEILDIPINIYPLFTINAYFYFNGFISGKIYTLSDAKYTQLVVMRAIYYFKQDSAEHEVISETVTIRLLILMSRYMALVEVGIFLHGSVMLRFRYRYALPKAIARNDRGSFQSFSKFS